MHGVTVNTKGQFSKRDSTWESNQGNPRPWLSDDLALSSDIDSPEEWKSYRTFWQSSTNIIYHNQAFKLQKHGQPPTCQVPILILLNANTIWPWCCIQLALLWLLQPAFSVKHSPSASSSLSCLFSLSEPQSPWLLFLPPSPLKCFYHVPDRLFPMMSTFPSTPKSSKPLPPAPETWIPF